MFRSPGVTYVQRESEQSSVRNGLKMKNFKNVRVLYGRQSKFFNKKKKINDVLSVTNKCTYFAVIVVIISCS